MALAPGTRLGPYEITAQLGAGGMGEVYRATDKKLKRQVAIKILPAAVAADRDRVSRFQREAEVLAQLNHPNIANIYGLEESAGMTALVMELVEGEDLSRIVARGPVPVADALAIAKQIADAVEAAHEQLIIHRDLKPANIKVRPDGTVKVLDFGLSKAMEPVGAPAVGVSEDPTITTPALTRAGMILGTAAYMSPEQATGRPADKRSDIWAFGCVLYEMLTGRRAFAGDDVSDTLASVLVAHVDWGAVPAEVPGTVVAALQRCLQGDRRQRTRDIGDVRLALDGPLAADVSGAATTAAPARWSRLGTMLFAITAFLTGVIVTLAVVRMGLPRSRVAESQAAVRFSIEQPGRLSAPGRESVALSPDGTHLVYVVDRHLDLRALSEPAARPIEGTDAGDSAYARDPFFSPDGRWIGFWQQGQLKKVATNGGALLAIGDTAAVPFGISWGLDDKILFGGGGIWRLPAAGGKAEQVVTLTAGSLAERPQMLPGGTWILFTLIPAGAASFDEGQVVVQSRTSGERRVIVKGARDALYLASGYLVFGRGTTLLAQSFDVNRLTVSGGAVPLVEGVANGGSVTPIMHFAVSSTGALLYVPSTETLMRTRLVQVARDGTRSTAVDIAGVAWNPRFSPDGSRVAYGLNENITTAGPSDLWVMELERGTRTRVTFGGNNRFFPIWTRDGTRLTFANRIGNFIGSSSRLLTARADGTGAVETLLDNGRSQFPTSYRADGRTLAIDVNGDDGTRDIWMLPTDGEKKTPVPFIATRFQEQGGIFSPDGHWFAYVSNKSGQNDVYARPYPGPGGEIAISVGGGGEPVWARSGRELFYRREGKMMVVPVQASASSLKIGTPRVLFDDPHMLMLDVPASGGVANYDISPDGRHFAMVEPSGAPGRGTDTVRFQMVLNWVEELRQRVSSK
jgi:serine/threonine-protein kinase